MQEQLERFKGGYGVKKISEKVFQMGRTLIITEHRDGKFNMDDLEDGTLRVYPVDYTDAWNRIYHIGDCYVKVKGEWVYHDNLLESTRYVKKEDFKKFVDETNEAIRLIRSDIKQIGIDIGNLDGRVSRNTTDIQLLDSRVKNLELNGGGGGGGGISIDESGTTYFDNVLTAANQNNLVIGERIYCRGYYRRNDGGGANYTTVQSNDLKPWCIPTNSTWKDSKTGEVHPLYLEIAEKEQVNYRQFGAYLDGIQDDGPALVKAHGYADTVFTYEANGLTRVYTCEVVNHSGVIYKANNEAINCCSNVDLSGSSIIMDDTNAGWFGMYVWGDADSLFYDFELSDEAKKELKKDCFYFPRMAQGVNALPGNTVLKIEEDPYCARDDAGYLYTVARRELLLHDVDGIFSPPLGDDWNHAGGEEINCELSNYDDHSKSVMSQSFSKFKISYSYYPSQRGHFIGCDVYLNMSDDKYNTVFWCKRHNATVEGWNIRVNPKNMHNRRFKNSMIYIWDSMNVWIRDCHAFDNAGKGTMVDGKFENATSGYALRLTNCCDVHIQDCRFQGYWGCTAMDSVKNIHFNRCHMNRLDIHDYFYNLYATDCFFYNHGIQIGYGRGLCQFKGCQWYYNTIPLDCYPSSHMVEFDLTYGRSFEGKVIVKDCRIWSKNPPDDEINLFVLYFSPDATTITKHYELPEFVVRDVDIRCNNPDVRLNYFKVGGSRKAHTGKTAPSHIYGVCNDGSCIWQYYGRGVDYSKADTNKVGVGTIIRCNDTFLDKYKKTQFYNERFYVVTQAGELDYVQAAPTDTSGKEFKLGTATVRYVSNPNWKSKHLYSAGDLCSVEDSKFFPTFLFKCIQGGLSNGWYPTHTSGTVLEGAGDSVSEPDDCWWTFVAKTSSKIINWKSKLTVTKGQWLLAVNRLYEVLTPGTLDEFPPYDTAWFNTHLCGNVSLKFIGLTWAPRQWYAKGSYCVAGENVYQCAKHDGTTRGYAPTRGNPYTVDGDISWRYQKRVDETNE